MECSVVDVTPKQDGGILKEILKTGEGEETPQTGDKVFVHYVGTLESDGSRFDSSRDRGERFSFTLGKREVIEAWDLGVASMKKGEIAKLTCKSEYAYGSTGNPPKIPADATLIFEVELFEWHGEDLSQKKDGGIIRRNIVAGEGYQTPTDGAVLDVHIVGKLNGTVFDERDVKFPLGEGSEHNIPEGLETALEKFKKGEKSTIKLSPDYGYGKEGNVALGIPPGASLQYEVELHNFEKAKESWEMDQEEKNKYLPSQTLPFVGTDTDDASSEDEEESEGEGISDIATKGLDDEMKAESQNVLLAGHLNLAMAYLKLKHSIEARDHANKSLEMDKKNIKAFFRRGQAYMNLGEYELAQSDFRACLNIEGNNKAAKQQLQQCIANIKADRLKEKKLYGGMFEKFAKQDEVKQSRNCEEENNIEDLSKTEEKGDSGTSEKIYPLIPTGIHLTLGYIPVEPHTFLHESPMGGDVPVPEVMDLTHDKDGGVLKEILKSGEVGEGPLRGDRVTVHYVGTLAEDGSEVDSSRETGQQFEFTLGKGEVIKGWDLGVATMKKGEIARLTCKSDYAYGELGHPPKIPSDATLIFEIELYDWHGEDLSSKKDGGIIRRILVSGEGYLTPNDGAIVDVCVNGRVNGTVFDNREVKFPLGEGTEHNIPEGLERALERFKKGEKSTIKLSPKYAFGSAGNRFIGVPPGAYLEYEVELRNFDKARESWEMDQEEKVEQAKVCKDRGTAFFKQEKYRLAVKQYKKVLDFLQYDNGLDEEKKIESHSILLAGYLNLAMSYLKLCDNPRARDHAAKALEMDNFNVKAYFRRGLALLNMGEAEMAQMDFQACLDLDQNNKAALQQMKNCSARIKADKVKEKQLYGGMFDKFARQDKATRTVEHRPRCEDSTPCEDRHDYYKGEKRRKLTDGKT
ncbi:hypothetical protein Pcinc_036866 [Petrolisthes cinctipes]|uniref:peptidylprolyl isomerase n=1 Tax=Petrolisthes cinctipes TaxID=88211 RepID=A0AAE1BWU5_PETCI|nr:hypothetical protein Pcinc_036866 [Petrolisthes cinctipes]